LSDLLKCIDRVSPGEIWASRSEIDYLFSALRGTPGSRMIGCEENEILTKRESEVVRQPGEGLSNREIAKKLGLSEHTVKNYLFRAFEKIGVSSRVELLFYLLRQERMSADKIRLEDEKKGEQREGTLQNAAEEGFPSAQLRLRLAHLEGNVTEESKQSAYYWLSLAERNAQRILDDSRKVSEELRKAMNADEVKKLERSLALSHSQQARSFVLDRVGNSYSGPTSGRRGEPLASDYANVRRKCT
jgi:DNA-binding CsgD family transcriptional regulator